MRRTKPIGVKYVSDMTIKDADHYLECRHCVGPNNCFEYAMKCVRLETLKSGKVKILLFGERYWKGRDKIKKIRYVDAWRLREIESPTPKSNT